MGASNGVTAVSVAAPISGRPALDLCNTRLPKTDLLATPEQLSDWLRASGLATRPLAACEEDLDAAVRLRDALRSALLAADQATVGELAAAWLDEVPGRLRVDARTLSPRFSPAGQSCRCALVGAVLDALDLAREAPGRVRECAAEPCMVVYLDTSRNRSRRWCSMQRCGGRAKAAAYYRRHRAASV
jgi:predicted RNA-binding Zn ribbon-like protein